MSVMFSDAFEVSPEVIKEYGSIDISLDCDVPVFIDPFRLYASEKPEYQILHDRIVTYLQFIRDITLIRPEQRKLVVAEYLHFGEVNEIHLGFSENGNRGRGLGIKFGDSLFDNLPKLVEPDDCKRISKSTHVEKLCIITDGVGRDFVSDFTANLIKDYLCRYTELFAKTHIKSTYCESVAISRARFDSVEGKWKDESYYLPFYRHRPVLLVPRDILTRSDTWINKDDLVRSLRVLPDSITDEVLREKLKNTISEIMDPVRKMNAEEKLAHKIAFIESHPEIVDWYIKSKEDSKDVANEILGERIGDFERAYDFVKGPIRNALRAAEKGNNIVNTYEETRRRALHFKHVMEDMDVYQVLYRNGVACFDEHTISLLFRPLWIDTESDVSFESNNGRGPADVKISRGAHDKCMVEFKLATNKKLKQNLRHQVDVYKRAHEAEKSIEIIIYKDEREYNIVMRALREVGLEGSDDVILIDVSPKLSASNVK